jgi:hypothetical protein
MDQRPDCMGTAWVDSLEVIAASRWASVKQTRVWPKASLVPRRYKELASALAYKILSFQEITISFCALKRPKSFSYFAPVYQTLQFGSKNSQKDEAASRPVRRPNTASASRDHVRTLRTIRHVLTIWISGMRPRPIRIATCRILPLLIHFPANTVSHFSFSDRLALRPASWTAPS